MAQQQVPEAGTTTLAPIFDIINDNFDELYAEMNAQASSDVSAGASLNLKLYRTFEKDVPVGQQFELNADDLAVGQVVIFDIWCDAGTYTMHATTPFTLKTGDLDLFIEIGPADDNTKRRHFSGKLKKTATGAKAVIYKTLYTVPS